MSTETKKHLDAAIAAHVADEQDGAIVTGYVLQTSNMNSLHYEKGTTGYLLEFAENQPFHVGVGLAQMLALGLEEKYADD